MWLKNLSAKGLRRKMGKIGLRSVRVVCLTLCFFVACFQSAYAQAPRAAPAQAPSALTNSGVLSMVKAGFSEGIIIEKIRTSATQFDTSVEALTALKEAGVTDTVIRLMINPTSNADEMKVAGPGVGGAAAPGGCEAGPGQTPRWISGASPAMWYSEQGTPKRIEMTYERGTINHIFAVFVRITLLELHPIKATLRLKGGEVFWTCLNPTDGPLVKFSLDQKSDERNTSLGRGGPWSQGSSISKDDLVPITYQKTPQGYWEVKPAKPLSAGEYGFVPQGTGIFGLGERVYAFGID